MLKMKFPEGISGASHEGVEYYPNEEGFQEVESLPERVIQHFDGLGFTFEQTESPEVPGDEGLKTGNEESTETPGDTDQDRSGASESTGQPPAKPAAKKKGK